MSLSVVSEFDAAMNSDGEAAPEVHTAVSTHTEAELLADLLPDNDAPPARLSDARADVPISETSERFLRAVLLKVPLDRIEELYLFAPLRQGAVETGIAVVAARTNTVPAVAVVEAQSAATNGAQLLTATDTQSAAATRSEVATEHHPIPDIADEEAHDVVAADATDEVAVDSEIASPQLDASGDNLASHADSEIDATTSANDAMGEEMMIEMELSGDDDSPYAPEPVSAIADALPEIPDALAHSEETFEVRPPVRHTVYTARYRLVVKGPDRGKWEHEVVDEADAPLLTIETVVRGVQRRAGEETETVRYSGPQLARALRIDTLATPQS